MQTNVWWRHCFCETMFSPPKQSCMKQFQVDSCMNPLLHCSLIHTATTTFGMSKLLFHLFNFLKWKGSGTAGWSFDPEYWLISCLCTVSLYDKTLRVCLHFSPSCLAASDCRMVSLNSERWLTWHSTTCRCRRCPTTLESTYISM